LAEKETLPVASDPAAMLKVTLPPLSDCVLV